LQNDDGSWPPLTPNLVNYLPGLSPPMYRPASAAGALAAKALF
jgi:hypothetical protein